MKRNDPSPWGPIQHCTEIREGIWRVHTASHGGIWLSPERLSEFTSYLGYEYPTFCGSPSWFEEDCDACLIPIVFAHDDFETAVRFLRSLQRFPRFATAYQALLDSGCIAEESEVQA